MGQIGPRRKKLHEEKTRVVLIYYLKIKREYGEAYLMGHKSSQLLCSVNQYTSGMPHCFEQKRGGTFLSRMRYKSRA